MRRSRTPVIAWIPPQTAIAVAFALSACHRSGEEKIGRTGGPSAELSSKTTAKDGSTQRAPGTDREPIVHVPVGAFKAGSSPLEPGRHPETEPWPHSLTLGPFRIDRHPRAVPEPTAAGGTKGGVRPGFAFEEAQVVCAEGGGRLCTEVEWERACKGPQSSVYAGGDSPCTGPSCVSGYEVEGLGAGLEWTSSSFESRSPFRGQHVLRGSPHGAAPAERRCARRLADGETTVASEPVTFRCCYGAPNAQRLKDPEEKVAFREVDLPLSELGSLLGASERTKELTQDLAYFHEDAASTVLARGPGDTMGFALTTRAVVWSPAQGVEILVVAGRSGARTAFVVAYFTAGSERVLAGSFIMKNEPGPIALAYATSIRPRMHFSGCWGCPGETGKLLFRPPESLVLLQP